MICINVNELYFYSIQRFSHIILNLIFSFFDIQYPNVYITAEKGGNLTIQVLILFYYCEFI